MRIGLFGGSFNPAHEGHRLASLHALHRLRLDAVWWLVTPGNPLKDNGALPDLVERMNDARKVAQHPKLWVTGFEAMIGTRFTFSTISWLVRRCPGVNFVWIMGADNLAGFHRWQRWRDIADLVPIAVIDRPGSTLRASSGQAGAYFAPHLLPESNARLLPGHPTPALVFLHGRRSSQSSTAIRKLKGLQLDSGAHYLQ